MSMFGENLGLARTTEQQQSPVEVRELWPETLWRGSVNVPEHMSREEFQAIAKTTAEELNFTFSGYETGRQGTGFNYYFSRYPRRAFGPVAPVETYQNALRELSSAIGAEGTEEALTIEPRFRVLLGLEEGYAEGKKRELLDKIEKGEIANIEQAKSYIKEKINDTSKIHSFESIEDLEELKDLLETTNFSLKHSIDEVSRITGNDFQLTPAKICSIGSWGQYEEPAVIIEGDMAHIQKVYALAEQFRQARIAVEDLHNGQAHMVETKYCEDPDKE